MLNLKKKRSVIWEIPSNEFVAIVKEKNNFTEILNHFGLKMHGANNRTLKDRIEYEKIDITHIIKSRNKMNKEHLKKIHEKNKIPLKKILVADSTYNTNFHLKKRLLKEGLLKEECIDCGVGAIWNGKPLKLQLEHKNGISNDNRLENLCLLCPNCHSQTPTYCGKSKRKYYYCKSAHCNKSITKDSNSGLCNPCFNKSKAKVKNRPSRLELLELILNKPFTQIGKQYGVSDNAVRKWCKSEGLPSKAKDIKEQKETLEQELERNKIST